MVNSARAGKTIGILTSGGDCAGLNAAIRAVVSRAVGGLGWRVLGIRHGTMGLLRRPLQFEQLDLRIATVNILRLGGTILGTTNKGDPFAFPMPDGSLKDRSGEVIAGIRELGSHMPPFTVPSETVIEMNGWVLLFGIGLAFATAVIFGLFPALQASRVDVQDALRGAGKGLGGTVAKSRMRNAVIVVEVALSLILLFMAGLFMRSFVAIQNVPLGWQPDHLLIGRIPLPSLRYKTGPQLVSFFDPLIHNLKSTPGIEDASPVSTTPPYGGFGGNIEIPGKTHNGKWESLVQLVGEAYFSIVRQPLVSGRSFTGEEVSTARKVVVVK